ncbi:MAG: hypothetical protein ACFCBU_04190 [Cyanophyceae cyanobacterium]
MSALLKITIFFELFKSLAIVTESLNVRRHRKTQDTLKPSAKSRIPPYWLREYLRSERRDHQVSDRKLSR